MSICIPVENLKEGMELEVAVKNQYGQLLIPVNTVITEKHKTIFKTWGINSVHIKVESGETGVADPGNIEMIAEMQLLRERFKWAPRNINEEDIFKMVQLKNSVYDN